VDSLICPGGGRGYKRIIAFIENYRIAKKILYYLGIYESQRKVSSGKGQTNQISLTTKYVIIV
jgi:hypothetical protein